MTTDSSSDEAQAIAQTLSGQRDAFELLVERYLPSVKAYLLSRTGNLEDAADMTQETFLKAFRALPSLRASDKFGPWLIAIARNSSQNLFASRARERLALEKQPPPSAAWGPSPEHDEIRAVLLQQVAALPEPLGEVLVLHYFGGLSTREAGAVLGISKWATEKRLQRARRALGERVIDQLGAALKSRHARKEDVLAVMTVVRSVIAPHTGHTPSPVEIPRFSSWNSTPWLMAGVALLALVVVMVWKVGSPGEDRGQASQSRPATTQTTSPPASASKTPAQNRAQTAAAANAKKPSKDSDSNAPKPSVPIAKEAASRSLDIQSSLRREWFAILPRQSIVRDRDELVGTDSAGQFSVQVSSWARGAAPGNYQLEIRSGDGKVLRGKVAYRPQGSPRGDAVLSMEDPIYFSDKDVREVGVQEPGKYLMALTHDSPALDNRVSNVASFVIDPAFVPNPDEPLTLTALEPPGKEIPGLGIQAGGLAAEDAAFTNKAVSAAEVLVDGSLRRVVTTPWTGRDVPIFAGTHYAVIKDISSVSPGIVSASGATIKVRVGRYESNAVSVPATYPDARAWDAGTPLLGKTPTAQAQLTGVITGAEGEPGSKYTVKLTAADNEKSKSYTELPSGTGMYTFHSVPPGRYTLHCVSETAELQVTDIDIVDKQPLQLDVTMARRFHFSGHVQDGQGAPLADAKVSASWQDVEGVLYKESTRTDPQGRYELAAPLSLALGVKADKPGYTDPNHQEGMEKYQGVLTGRNDIDFVLTRGDENPPPAMDQQEDEPGARPRPPRQRR